MPEQTELTPEVEVATLRKVRDELLTKSHAHKARITELESQALQLTEKANKATTLMRTAIIDRPLRKMVSELSNNVPELVMRELLEDFTFDAGDDGSIVMKTKSDGKPIAAKSGKPVAWDKHSLHLYLIGDGYVDKNARQSLYTHLLGVPSGSGGIGRKLPMSDLQKSKTSDENNSPVLSFGLR